MKSKLSNRLEHMRKLREEKQRRERQNEEKQGGREPAEDAPANSLGGSADTSKRSADTRTGRRSSEERELFKGWQRRAPLVLGRTVCIPFLRDSQAYSDAGQKPGPELGRPYRGFLIPEAKLSRTLFYDFETTGLSGGAGTYIFLAGVGRFCGNSIQVDQLFLEDYPGEPDFLAELKKLIPEEDVCVSYNGKRFDRHLLTTRSRMSGVEVQMGPQVDLLFPVRSIWKNALGSCRLANVEEKILKCGREGDIDGADIPECYFRYLRGEASTCLKKVIEHHLQDITSLVHLLFTIEAAAQDSSILVQPYAREGMGALLLKHGDPGGMQLLEEQLQRGSLKAGKLAALSYRKQNMYVEMERVLEEMWRLDKGFFQGEALAKIYEHHKRDISGAIKIVEILRNRSSFLPSRKRGELEHRWRRLREKLSPVRRQNYHL
ncbi:MAG: ribonuclease H-like domain-containing protein [Spirochaetaceae bacterium]